RDAREPRRHGVVQRVQDLPAAGTAGRAARRLGAHGALLRDLLSVGRAQEWDAPSRRLPVDSHAATRAPRELGEGAAAVGRAHGTRDVWRGSSDLYDCAIPVVSVAHVALRSDASTGVTRT